MKTCEQCGHWNKDRATFCAVCGNRIVAQPESSSQDLPSTSRRKWVGLPVLLVLCLGLGFTIHQGGLSHAGNEVRYWFGRAVFSSDGAAAPEVVQMYLLAIRSGHVEFARSLVVGADRARFPNSFKQDEETVSRDAREYLKGAVSDAEWEAEWESRRRRQVEASCRRKLSNPEWDRYRHLKGFLGSGLETFLQGFKSDVDALLQGGDFDFRIRHFVHSEKRASVPVEYRINFRDRLSEELLSRLSPFAGLAGHEAESVLNKAMTQVSSEWLEDSFELIPVGRTWRITAFSATSGKRIVDRVVLLVLEETSQKN